MTLVLCRSTGRQTAGRAKLLYRSTGRSTDMHQSAVVHFGRPAGRPEARAVPSVCSGRPARSTDREFHSLFGIHGRPSGLPLFPTVGNPTAGGRPAGRPSTVRFSTVGDSGRPDGRPLFPTRELNSLSVDRAGRPDPTESKALAVVRPPSRPTCTNALWCMSVDRQSNFSLVD